jgi:sugar phosphate isomerase/epimerase
MKFGICNEMFQDWKIEDVFNYAKEVGYDGVEVAPFTLADSVELITPEQRQALKRSAAEAGVEIVGTHWLLVSPEGLHITTPDDEIRSSTCDYFHALINYTADIGGTSMILGSPKQRSVMEGVSYEQAWSNARAMFTDLAVTAENRAVTLCIEPLAPVETDFINTAEEAIRMAQEVDSSAIKIILDAKAMSSESKPIGDIIRASEGWVGHVHANDPNLQGPGFGDLEYAPIVNALSDIGYDGWVDVEVFDFDIDPKETATRSIEYLHKQFGVS